MEMETDELLTIKVTTIVPATPEVLRERLADRRAECDRRAAKYKGWAGTVSGKWLLDDIAKLEATLSQAINADDELEALRKAINRWNSKPSNAQVTGPERSEGPVD